MKKVFFSLIILLFCSTFAFSQDNAPAANAQQNVIIKPKVEVNDIIFAINALNTIEITGTEVDNFIIVKGALEQEFLKAQKAKMLTTDSVSFDIQLNTAQTLVNFLSHAKITGANAVRYKTFIEAFVVAAKNYQATAATKKSK